MKVSITEKPIEFKPFTFNIEVEYEDDLEFLQHFCFYKQSIPKALLDASLIDSGDCVRLSTLMENIANYVEIR